MSSSGDDTDWVKRTEELRDGEEGFGAVLEKILVIPIVALGLQAANLLEATFDFFIVPTTTFTTGLSDVVWTLLTGVSSILGSGAAGSSNQVRMFGIGSFPIAIGIILAGGLVWASYTQMDTTSDLIPFSSTDIPLVGNDEED